MVLLSKSSYKLPKSATGKGRRQGRQRKQEWEGRLQAITSLRKHRGGKKELLNKLHQAEHVMNVSPLTLPPKTRLSSLVRVTLCMKPWQMQTALPPHLPSLSLCFSKHQHTKHPLSLALHSSLFNPHPKIPCPLFLLCVWLLCLLYGSYFSPTLGKSQIFKQPLAVAFWIGEKDAAVQTYIIMTHSLQSGAQHRPYTGHTSWNPINYGPEKKSNTQSHRVFGNELKLIELLKLASTTHFLQSLDSSISHPRPACSAVLAQIATWDGLQCKIQQPRGNRVCVPSRQPCSREPGGARAGSLQRGGAANNCHRADLQCRGTTGRDCLPSASLRVWGAALGAPVGLLWI